MNHCLHLTMGEFDEIAWQKWINKNKEPLQHYGCGPAWVDWVRPSMEIVAETKRGAAFKA